MIETIRNYFSRRNTLKTQMGSMERELATTKGADLDKLKQILDTAKRGLVMLDTSLDKPYILPQQGGRKRSACSGSIVCRL